MKILLEEMKARFPEIHEEISGCDEDSAYLIMGCLADWLKKFKKITPDTLDRIIAFTKWCEAQPRGQDAGNDIYTILSVGFYENLFDSAITRAILPRLIPRAEFLATADYFKQWVGVENYEKALKEYK